jgi:anti-anti-sigma factor
MASTHASHLQGDQPDSGEPDKGVTTVRCPSRLVAENIEAMKEKVAPLIRLGGNLSVDMAELNYLDSSGLGTLLALKVSSMKQGTGTLHFVNLTPRIIELLRITHLEKIFLS